MEANPLQRSLQVVAAAKWLGNNHGIEVVGEITSKTLAGIRREGKDRGKQSR